MAAGTRNVSQQIGRYRISRHVASDEISDIYLAYGNGHENQPVALRVISGHFAGDRDIVATFRQSLARAAHFKSRNIARVIDVGVTPIGKPYVVLDFAPAYFLHTYLQNRAEPLQPAEALQMIVTLAGALADALHAGLLHHDLRPENIMLKPNHRPVLIGLDTPILVNESDKTRPYRSPEQRQGKVLDARSNVYSLGAILYELLAGTPPQYDADGVLVPLEEVRPGLSSQTYHVVRKSLREESWARFQTMSEMLKAARVAMLAELPRDEMTTAQTVPIRGVPLVTKRAADSRPQRGQRVLIPVLLLLLFIGACMLSLRALVEYAPSFLDTGVLKGNAGEDGGAARATQVAAELPPPQIEIVTPTTTLAATASVDTTDETSEAVPPTPTLVVPETPTVAPTAETVPGLVTAMRWDSPPAIDGDLSEWMELAAVASSFRVHEAPNWDGSADISTVWRLAWDANNLYLAAAVVDDLHVQTQTGSAMYRGDSLEVQFDTQPGLPTGSTLSPDNFQLLLSPGNFETLAPEAFRFQGTFTGELASAPGHNVMIAAQRTNDGYVLEAAVPWSDLALTVQEGQQLGLALNANDNDLPGEAVQEVMMSNVSTRTLTDPSSWGILTLQ